MVTHSPSICPTHTRKQRGLYVYVFIMLDLTAGPIVYSLYTHSSSRSLSSNGSKYVYMLVKCYLSTAEESVKEQLWRLIQDRKDCWVSAHPLGCLFYIREDLLSFALLIDSTLWAQPKHDHIL